MDPGSILTFGSLQDLSEFIDEEIEKSQKISEGYNERLGIIMRENESREGSKKIKRSNGGKRWVPYGRLMLFGGSPLKGEAEILFGTVDDLKSRIQQLNEAKKVVSNLSKVGMGETPTYIVQFRNNVPSRIVIFDQSEADRPRLKFDGQFIVPNHSTTKNN